MSVAATAFVAGLSATQGGAIDRSARKSTTNYR